MTQILTVSLFITSLSLNTNPFGYISISICIYISPTGPDFLGNPNTCLICQFSPSGSHTRFPLYCLSLGSTRQTGFWLLRFQSLSIPGFQIALPFLCRTIHFSKYAYNHHLAKTKNSCQFANFLQ